MLVLKEISLSSKIALGIAGIIILVFFIVQTCVVFGVCENTMFLAKFGYACIIGFMPPFFKVIYEFFIKTESDDINIAIDEFDGEFEESDLRLFRLKFVSDFSN